MGLVLILQSTLGTTRTGNCVKMVYWLSSNYSHQRSCIHRLRPTIQALINLLGHLQTFLISHSRREHLDRTGRAFELFEIVCWK